jgi:hypothetical protein
MTIKIKELADGIIKTCASYHMQCPSDFGIKNIDGGCRDEKGVFRCEECVTQACESLVAERTR